jgi:hypothetical protein
VAAGQMLDDQKALLEVIQELGIAANRIPAILQSASSRSDRLRSEAETSAVLSTLVGRVELGQTGFRLTLNPPTQIAEKPDTPDPTNLAMTRLILLQLKRPGVELLLVIDGNGGRGATMRSKAKRQAVGAHVPRATRIDFDARRPVAKLFVDLCARCCWSCSSGHRCCGSALAEVGYDLETQQLLERQRTLEIGHVDIDVKD